jgi:hypothetical protein
VRFAQPIERRAPNMALARMDAVEVDFGRGSETSNRAGRSSLAQA